MSDLKMGWWTQTEHDATHLAAADWLVRLQNPAVTEEETVAWQAWMNADARHAQAFARIEEMSDYVQQLEFAPQVRAQELARDTYDASVPLKDWREPPARIPVFKIAAAIAVLAVGLSGIAYFSSFEPSQAQTFATTVGENRTFSLDDGSTIALGGDSEVSVLFSQRRRDIQLDKGEALFTVSPQTARPFRVRVGQAMVIALGTQFNVRRSHDRAVVSVTEGRVLVEPTGRILPTALLRELKPKLRPVQLSAGQQTQADSSGIDGASTIEDVEATVSWRSGQLTFRLQPLRYVLEDVNRYVKKPIVLGDEGLQELLVTGMVRQENVNGWVESLERAFSLVAREESDRVVLTRRMHPSK